MAKILFVDDQPDAAMPVRIFLENAGHSVTCVLNGKDALSHLLVDMPDVVILDLAMPEMDGPSFLEVVRSYLRLQSLPVVVLTGLEESPMVAKSQALKVNSVLVKSKATPEDVLKAVEEAAVRMPG
jgi:CheY-like chemotaxis protein